MSEFQKFINTLQEIMKTNEHLTPTLNDIHDTFLEYGIKNIERNEILKALKHHIEKKTTLQELIKMILKNIA